MCCRTMLCGVAHAVEGDERKAEGRFGIGPSRRAEVVAEMVGDDTG